MIREAESMRIEAFPTASQHEQWLQSVENGFRAMSGRGDEAWRWIREVRRADVTIEDLNCSAAWESVDAKLFAALMTAGLIEGANRNSQDFG